MIQSLPGAVLSCSAKKVPKECGIGEALSVVLPPPQAPSPMYPTRALFTLIVRCFGFEIPEKEAITNEVYRFDCCIFVGDIHFSKAGCFLDV